MARVSLRPPLRRTPRRQAIGGAGYDGPGVVAAFAERGDAVSDRVYKF